MKSSKEAGTWTCTDTIVNIESPWVRLIAEHWRDDQDKVLDYWRVERAHSVIVIPIWREQVLLPQPQFRPGVQRLTLDLPGGRVPATMTPTEAAPGLLQKELGIAPEAVQSLDVLNTQGWIINSSFSNQLLYGLLAHIDANAELDSSRVHRRVACSLPAITALIEELECLQCRAVLQSWLLGYPHR